MSQLGSQQITSGLLKQNTDRSYTLWVAPQEKLPAEADPHNWIPTPSKAYYESIYGSGSNVSTDIRLMIRMYDPAQACPGPSIIPCSGSVTYVLPLVEQVQ